jgi:hypothetical protein
MSRTKRAAKRESNKGVTRDQASRAALRFWALMYEWWLTDERGEMNEGDFYELATKAGLMSDEAYEPEGKHADVHITGSEDLEPGDCVFVVNAVGLRAQQSVPK